MLLFCHPDQREKSFLVDEMLDYIEPHSLLERCFSMTNNKNTSPIYLKRACANVL